MNEILRPMHTRAIEPRDFAWQHIGGMVVLFDDNINKPIAKYKKSSFFGNSGERDLLSWTSLDTSPQSTVDFRNMNISVSVWLDVDAEGLPVCLLNRQKIRAYCRDSIHFELECCTCVSIEIGLNLDNPAPPGYLMLSNTAP
jgi:hypothetical protein